jgi:hypothetical protein
MSNLPDLASDELRILQMLCQCGLESRDPGFGSAFRDAALNALRTHTFSSTTHQVFFDCLWQMRRHPPKAVQSSLPAKLVQAGFPDFDWEIYFEPHHLDAAQGEELLAQFKTRQ